MLSLDAPARLTLPAAANVLRWLIWDTFRQAIASRIFAVMLIVSVVAMIFCAGVGVRGERLPSDERDPAEFVPRGTRLETEIKDQTGVFELHGELSLAFGAIRVPHARDPEGSVQFLQLLLAAGVAGTLGMLIALTWTAGFLPAFLEPAAASILLTKPAPRWLMMLGKYFGMLVFVAVQAAVFVGGTWLMLGFATGVWNEIYLLAVPLLVLQFAFFYGVSMLLAAATRSTAVSTIGAVLFWLLCMSVNTARVETATDPDASRPARLASEAAYWILPKPVDFNLIVGQALRADKHFAPWPALKQLEKSGRFLPGWSIATSALFAGAVVLGSARLIGRVEY